MKSQKAPKAAVLEVLAQEPLARHTREAIAKSLAIVKNGELDKPSHSTIYNRIKALVKGGVDILSLLDGYLLVPKDSALWTKDLFIAIEEAKNHYESFNDGNQQMITNLNRVSAQIPEDVKKQITA